MEAKVLNNILYLYPTGRIDSSNAAQVDAQVDEIMKNSPAGSMIIDTDNLEYISSAGLRVILKLRKLIPDLKIINASSDIYDIFEMTGFTEMMTIEKGYRKLSVEGCEVIGQGANGKVYRLDSDTIIKVYLNPDSLPDIHRERELARKAFVLGIPTAIPYDVVKVGEGYGSVFELLSAKSFAQLIQADEANWHKYIDMSVELLKKIHETEVKPTDMPNMKEVVLDWAAFLKDYLPAEEGNKLYQMVNDIPVVHTMMHGDFHIKNVMLQNGESLLIDMDTLCWGHPIFELASMFNAYVGFNEWDEETETTFLGVSFKLSAEIYEYSLQKYFEGVKSASEIEAINKKASIIGYARIIRRSIRRHALESDDGRAKVDHYKNQLIKLLHEVDDLSF